MISIGLIKYHLKTKDVVVGRDVVAGKVGVRLINGGGGGGGLLLRSGGYRRDGGDLHQKWKTSVVDERISQSSTTNRWDCVGRRRGMPD